MPQAAAYALEVFGFITVGGLNGGTTNNTYHWFDWETGEFVGRARPNSGECPGHGDFGVDSNGNDVYVGICKGGASWTEPFRGKMTAMRLRDGAMWAFGPGSTYTSCDNTARPGWCYGNGIHDPALLRANRLDGGRTEWYADLQDFDGSTYWEYAMAYPSPDGTKVAFTSTWSNTIPGDARTFVLDLAPLAGGGSVGSRDPVVCDGPPEDGVDCTVRGSPPPHH